MGMGYSANREITISTAEVEKIVPYELSALETIFKKYDISLKNGHREVYEILEYDNYDVLKGAAITDEDVSFIEGMYKTLREEFKKKTGLTIWIQYHDHEEEGDRYDDIEGLFFCLGGTHEETPEFVKLKELGIQAKESYYVTFG